MERPTVAAKAAAGNPFWIAVFVVWIIMLIVGATLALALGIWTLIEAF